MRAMKNKARAIAGAAKVIRDIAPAQDDDVREVMLDTAKTMEAEAVFLRRSADAFQQLGEVAEELRNAFKQFKPPPES